jgi:phenylacetate-coenzyme A ligase PaaK-like adenylate-forming protein
MRWACSGHEPGPTGPEGGATHDHDRLGLRRFDPADRLRALAGEQLARDRWSRDRLLAFQAERLRALIAHAVAASPYYRDLLGPDAASGEVPLSELPTLPNPTLMDSFDRIVTNPRLRRAELEAHLAGPAADRPYRGRYRLFTTAGTTGQRGLFVDDVEEFAVWLGTGPRGLASWGPGPGIQLAGIGSPSPLPISNQLYAVLLAGRPGAAPRLAVTTPLPEMVAALNTFRPQALTAYATVAAALAEERSRAGCGSPPPWSPPPRRCRPPTSAGASPRPGAGAAELLRHHRGRRRRRRPPGTGRHGHP